MTPPPFLSRRYELGRQPANTKLAASHAKDKKDAEGKLHKVTTGDVALVRCRGGNMKYRALRLDHGNFSWGSENVTRKTRIMDVTYNASNNELVRTKTPKSAVVQMDAAPFRAWYQQHYGKKIGIKVKNGEKVESEDIDEKRSNALAKKLKERNAKHCRREHRPTVYHRAPVRAVTSRPGHCGRCDGYVLEGKELDFYLKKMQKKKSKAGAE